MPETVLLKGAPLAKAVKEQVAVEVRRLSVAPRLAVVLASTDPGAASYAQSKQKAAASLGINVELTDLGANADQALLEHTLADLGSDNAIHGILLELPLAKGLDSDRALEAIPPHKDVDGLTARNLGLALANRE